MECIGARNFAAMAVSTCPTWRYRKKRQRNKLTRVIHRHSSYTSSLRVRSSSAGSESCVAFKEGFADEENYIKAGGSEHLFVQMQQNKLMEKQSKLADKLPRISVGNTILDLVVIGCGPAGLALAAESAKLGLSVGLIGPDLPFTNNYGVWEDEFRDLGLEGCIEHVWGDTIVYLDDNDPILIGRAYGRVSRYLLHEELVKRCVESGVSYLSSKVERIIESTNGHSLIECEQNVVVPCRLATVASGAASGKLLQYEVGGPRVSVQTAYGMEVEVENNPYDPNLMVFMDYRDYVKPKVQCLEAQYPTFLYAMPMSPTRVFFEETCLASKDAMPFDILKKKLISRLETMGVRVIKTYEEEWSYIPVGGSLPNTEQKNLAFGAAASMVHPATGYSVVRSLSEAPKYATVIANILKQGHSRDKLSQSRSTENISMLELMSKSSESKKDPAWQYARMVNPQNLSKFICNFCDKEMNGGVYRVKQHLAGGYKNVVACKKCPSHVKDEVKDYMSQKSQSKVQLRMVPDFNEMDNDDDDDDEILEINQHGKRPVSTQGSTRREQGSNSSKSVGSKQPKQKGPMDVYFTPDPEVAVQNRKAKGKQTRIDDNDPSKKVLRDWALVWFSRWMYDTGIPFNVVNYSSFGPMVEAFGQYGPGMKPPSYHEVRVPYLQKEVDHTNKTMEDHKKDWATYGCSLMADGWKDKRNRALINFLVNCPRGSMFIESVDASSLSKDANKMFELLDNFVERIGEANVVQVVTDSASANVLAGKFLEAKRPHLYWTPCAAHCLDLMLEDIFKIPNFNKTFEKAIAVHGYIVNRSGLLNMMRQFTQCKDLIKPAKTQFATAFLTLSRIHQQQTNLKKMFTSEEWTTSKWAKEPQGKKTAQVILMPSFWNNVLYALKISSPLVRVLRLVDGERKPPMEYIYEAMDRAKEAIAKSFNGNEEKYKEFFEIIDNRWNVQLHRPLHAAGYYLNPEYFYANPNIEKDKEVMSGLYKCIQRLVPSNETQDKVCAELTTYKKADGLFGMALAIRQRTTRAPAWNTLWPQERKRQRAFFLFGLALILQLDIDGIRTFFHTFFRLPTWMWQGFLGSTLSSADLALFAFYMFVIAPNNMRMCLVRHLLSDPTGATMIRTYLTI